jgi:hypothetical protein
MLCKKWHLMHHACSITVKCLKIFRFGKKVRENLPIYALFPHFRVNGNVYFRFNPTYGPDIFMEGKARDSNIGFVEPVAQPSRAYASHRSLWVMLLVSWCISHNIFITFLLYDTLLLFMMNDPVSLFHSWLILFVDTIIGLILSCISSYCDIACCWQYSMRAIILLYIGCKCCFRHSYNWIILFIFWVLFRHRWNKK